MRRWLRRSPSRWLTPRALLAPVLVLWLAAGQRDAAAQSAIVSDIAAESGATEEAGAASLLISSSLRASPQRPIVSRSDLAVALDAVSGGASRDVLSVDPDTAPRLMERLGADRLFGGRLSRTADILTLSAFVMGPEGRRLTTFEVRAPVGELVDLARQVAARLPPLLEGTAVDLPRTSARALRPYVAALRKLATGDFKGAGEELNLATPGSAAGLPAAQEVAQLVWQSPSPSTSSRVSAALAAGDAARAASIAEQALRQDPRDVGARAGKARALASLRDFDGAERELASLKEARDNPVVAVARAELAIQRGAPPEKRDEALAPVLHKPYGLVRQVLTFVVGTPPGTFSSKMESSFLGVAERVAPRDPAVASSIAYRAAQGDIEVKRALPLIRPAEYSLDELAQIRAKVEALGPADRAAGAPIEKAIAVRSAIAQQIQLSELSARLDDSLILLVDDLRPLLGRFTRLLDRAFARVTVVPLQGSGQPRYWPVGVLADRLRAGLTGALAAAPFEVRIARPPSSLVEVDQRTATEESLAAAARSVGADAMILYRIRPSGMDAEVDLLLLDVAEQKLYVVSAELDGGRTGLTRIEAAPAGAWLLVILALLGVGLLRSFTGAVLVQIRRQTGGADDILCVELNRSSAALPPPEPGQFLERMRNRASVRTARHATHVKREVRLRARPGRWYVHVYGVQWKGKQVSAVGGDAFTRGVDLRLRQTASIALALEGSHGEFIINVTDQGVPVAGARVWLNEAEAQAQRTGREGTAILQAGKGKHVIHVEAQGLHVEQPYEVIKPTVRTFDIKLDWERKRDLVSRALEGQNDDPMSYIDAPTPVTLPTSLAPPPSTQELGSTPPSSGVATASQGPSSTFLSSLTSAGTAPTVAAPPARRGTPIASPLPVARATPIASPLPVARATPVSAAPRVPPGPPSHATPPPAMVQALRSVTPVPVDAPGSVTGLSRYQRINELGRGAMGVVFKARDVVLDREVALKIMSPDIRDNPEIAGRFVREARALAALNHPNIVAVYDQGYDRHEIFMVMELVEGTTLEAILAAHGPLPVPQALELIDQLCAGMGYAHSKRIIHRDIKPSNVFVSTAGVVKIGDFGLARVMQSLRISKTQVQGTPLYMSPEQILGRDIDFRADLYAIGCTLFELLTGHPPFVEGEVLYHHVHTPPPRPSAQVPNVPPEVDELVLSCLAKDKESRIPSADHIRATVRPFRGVSS